MFEKIKSRLKTHYSKKLFEVCFNGVDDDYNDQNAIRLANKYLKLGADINYQYGSDVGYPLPPFLCACRRNATELINFLASKGADVQIKTFNLENGLMVCSNSNFRHETFYLLLELGVDINNRNIKGETLLHKEAKRINTPRLALLLENGANPNVVDNDGNTPLNALLISRNGLCKDLPTIKLAWYDKATKPSVEKFLEYGADPNIVNKDGKTSLDIELEGDYGKDVAYMLIKAGATSSDNKFSKEKFVEAYDDMHTYKANSGFYDDDDVL